MPQSQFTNILVVRTDRIGDVLLSLPMVHVLRANFPEARISFLLRNYTRELVEGQQGLDATLSIDSAQGPKSFLTMLSVIWAHNFDLVVLAYPTFRLALLMFLARISTRVGTGYRWYSFLFTRKVYEHRKTAEKHELEYNLSLLEAVGCSFERYPKPVLTLSREHQEAAEKILQELRLAEAERVVVLHPGSGGSARDWSLENFGKLAYELRARGYSVVVTGGPGEERLVQTVLKLAGDGVHALVNRLSLLELAALLRHVGLFISNSTGPLHIAAAVGTPVIGFYPPILACSPQRWGPYTDTKTVFVPDRNACVRCKGGPCQGNECMEQIEVNRVVQEVERVFSVLKQPIAEAQS
ncbi:MAG TPA: glycosyltransferase family 9 protein [Bacteroidota bacterium]